MTDKRNVHDLVDEWGAGRNLAYPGELVHEHLGITAEQYKRWAETGDLPHDSDLCDPVRDATPGAREADRRLRARARRRTLNRLAGRHRDEYLRLLNSEIKMMREAAREEQGEGR